MDTERSSRIARETPIIAKSMYLELVRAKYSREDVLRFVNQVLGHLTENIMEDDRDLDARSEPGVVLALGGGAARASAHVGVFRELRAADVDVLGVAGTSGGALIGALFALGLDADDMLARLEAFAASPLLRAMRREYSRALRARPRRPRERGPWKRHLAQVPESETSILPATLYAEMVEFFLGADRSIESLDVPFSATATDLVSGRPVELSRGSLHAAVRASCAVPGLFPGERIGEGHFVDGASLAEIPLTDSFKSSDASTLAVFLSRPMSRGGRLDTAHAISGRIDELMFAELVRLQLERREHMISVEVEEYGWLGFHNAARLAQIGAAAAREYLAAQRGEIDPPAPGYALAG